MTDPSGTSETKASARPHPAEWLLVGLEALLLGMLAYRHFHPGFLKGELLPSLALGLAPGTAWRLCGRRSIAAHRFGIALGLITFLFTDGTINLESIRAMTAEWQVVVPGLALVCLTPLLGALRWWILLSAQDIRLSYAEALRLTLVGFFFNTFVPGATGGDIFRAYYVARGCGRSGPAITSVLLDRCMGMPPLLTLVIAGAALNIHLFAEGGPFRPYATFIFGIGAAVLVLTALFVGLTVRAPRWLERIDGDGMLTRSLGALLRALSAYRKRWGVLGGVFLVGMLAHGALIGACILFGQAAGITDIPAGEYMLLAPLGLTVNAVPAAPGGLGQGEAAFAHLFSAASAAPNAATAGALIMLAVRLGMLLCGLVGGVLYVLGHHAIDAARHDAESGLIAEEGAGA